MLPSSIQSYKSSMQEVSASSTLWMVRAWEVSLSHACLFSSKVSLPLSMVVLTATKGKCLQPYDFESYLHNKESNFASCRAELFPAAPLQGQPHDLELYSRSAESNFDSRSAESFLAAPFKGQPHDLELYSRSAESNSASRSAESFLAAPLKGQPHDLKLYSRSAESNSASRSAESNSAALREFTGHFRATSSAVIISTIHTYKRTQLPLSFVKCIV